MVLQGKGDSAVGTSGRDGRGEGSRSSSCNEPLDVTLGKLAAEEARSDSGSVSVIGVAAAAAAAFGLAFLLALLQPIRVT